MDIDPREVARLKWIEGMSWTQLEELYECERTSFRRQAGRYKKAHPEEFEVRPPKIEGVTPDEPDALPDPEIVYQRAERDFDLLERKMQRKRQQSITFEQPVIALAWSADWHVGGRGVDYGRLREEMELIRDTPNIHLILGGDLVDNFVIGSLRAARSGDSISIPNQWALVKMIMRIASKKTIAIIEGNHEGWTRWLIGIDYFREAVQGLTQNALYDPHEVVFDLRVGDWKLKVKARHKWRGHSQYNMSHAVEKDNLFNERFDIGLMAHTHASGLTRQFSVEHDGQVETGIALLAGAYKRYDPHARKGGFRKPNGSTTVGVIIDSRYKALIGFDNLRAMARWIGEA